MAKSFYGVEQAATDGTRHAVVWHNGHRCVYEGGELIEWSAPGDDDGPAQILAGWSQDRGWPEGAVDAAGRWHLVDEGAGRKLVGPKVGTPRQIAFHLGVGRKLVDWDGSGLSRHARLSAGPSGTLVLDPGRGLIWALEAKVAIRLSDVHEECRLFGVAVVGGVVVHLTWQQRSGVVARLGFDGSELRHDRFGGASPMWLVDGKVHAVLPKEPGTADDHGLYLLDPRTLEAEYQEEMLPENDHASAVGGGSWLTNDGHTAVLFRRVDGRWTEHSRFTPPQGDPTSMAGEARLAPVEEQHWSGPPGGFEVALEICNQGQNVVGVHLAASGPGTVSLQSATLGAQTMSFREGRAAFDSLKLPSGVPLPMLLRGKAMGPGAVRVRVVDGDALLGRVDLKIETEAGVTAVRGARRLALESAWIAALGKAGVLDPNAVEPDLDRWLQRALRRARVEAVEEDPDAVLAEWKRMTERERSVASAEGIPAFKLATGKHWLLSEAEARAIGEALGTDHPFGGFAAAGAFEVVGDPSFGG